MNNENTATVIAFLGEFMEFLQAKETAKKTAVEPPAPKYLTAKEFAAAAGIELWRAYDFATKNHGTLSFKDTKNGNKWMIREEALEQFKRVVEPVAKKVEPVAAQVKGKHSRAPIPVRCHELNKTFASLGVASRETKISTTSIRKSTKTGEAVGSYHFSVAI